jgi:hypothetical protein
MAGPFITPSDLLQFASDVLHKEAEDLDPSWQRLASRAVTQGWAELANIILARGYSAAQLDAWDFRANWNADQALYMLLGYGAGLSDYPTTFRDSFDHRKELAECATIMLGGVAVAPPADNVVGGIGYGTLTAIRAADCASEFWELPRLCRRCGRTRCAC